MHSTIVRTQNVFGFFTTVAFTVAALIACSDLLAPRTPKAIITLKDTQVYASLAALKKPNKLILPRSVRGRPHYYSSKKEEYAHIKFSLSADLSSLFTWNTKQVFVYVSATWPDVHGGNATNEAVIWDTIITNPSADHLQNIGPAAMRKLVKSSKGKTIDPSRYVPFVNERVSCYVIRMTDFYVNIGARSSLRTRRRNIRSRHHRENWPRRKTWC